ncbi:unnamed protein product [Paramecium sonneborni]|uniref:Uncharacterized protein n=1 Tax=Paramecium sonneborni TaxID=65129 RepID=A0A8S1NGL5_9CILI|nr:unnamed protein product [Paramecium sonneborni]
MCQEETTQVLLRELRLKTTIDQLNKNLKQQQENQRKITNEINQFKFELQSKEHIISELKNQLQQQQQQNNEIINELIEQKNQNIQNSVYDKDYKSELNKITKENEELKNNLKGVNFQLNIQKEKESQQIKEIASLRQMQSNLSVEIERLQNKINELKLELLNHQQESQNKVQEKEGKISQLMNQLSLLKNQDIIYKFEQKYKFLKDIQLKNNQITMLQNENNQLVKLIESLKNEQIQNQGTEQIKIKQLESELKNLQSFRYDSPLVVLFNLLEDRLSKQQQKSFKKGKRILGILIKIMDRGIRRVKISIFWFKDFIKV